MEIYKTPIHQLHQKRQNQEISSTQIVESVWQRIEQHQDKLNTYLCLEKKEKLLQKAEQIDEQIQKGAEKYNNRFKIFLYFFCAASKIFN